MSNIILSTDSYKLTHWQQYPPGTETVYSYMEARKGAQYPYTVFFGLQALIKQRLIGRAVSWDDVEEASHISAAHLGVGKFNYQGWSKLLTKHRGRLPIRIKAVKEGSAIPVGNVLMTIENTDPEFFWLTNALESILMHVWYPSTVATLSRFTKETIVKYLENTSTSTASLPFMLHDFGYRGATSDEAAEIGGAAHLLNFSGTDTLPALVAARDYYGADLSTLAFSVPATEHSVMTARGREGEYQVVEQLLDEYPAGTLAVVADSFNIYKFVNEVCSRYHDRVMARDGKLIIRPDSVTQDHPNPESLMVWILDNLWVSFGGTVNVKGNKIIDSHVGVIWGDGIDPVGIERILAAMALHGYSAENVVFGMGGGLLQRVNRDTQRFAIKASAIEKNGVWSWIGKDPLDSSKRSKIGRLALVETVTGHLTTIQEDTCQTMGWEDQLEPVFENGVLLRDQTFSEIRELASLPVNLEED